MQSDGRAWLAALLQPLDPTDFLQNYWPSSSVVVHSPLDRFPELAKNPALASPEALLASVTGLVRVWCIDSAGHFRDETTSPLAALSRYQDGDATVVIDSLEARGELTFLQALMAGLASDLETPQNAISCNAYLSRAGARTACHFDQQEVFLLQVAGSKSWRIAPNPETPFPTDHYNPASGFPSKEIRMLTDRPNPPEPDAEAEHTLERGSVLFLPRGYWHRGQTLADSLGLTLTFNSATWMDIFLRALRARLVPNQLLRTPAAGFYAPVRSTPTQESLSAALAILEVEAKSLSPNDFLTLRQEELSLLQHFWVRTVAAVRVDDLPEGRALLVVELADSSPFELELPSHLAPFARWLATSSQPGDSSAAEPLILEFPAEDAATLLRILVERGHLVPPQRWAT